MSTKFDIEVRPIELRFKQPAVTSRGTMLTKRSCLVKICEKSRPMKFGLGECALFEGLSAEDTGDFNQFVERVRQTAAQMPDEWPEIWEGKWLPEESSIRFGLETAIRSLSGRHQFEVFPSPLTYRSKPIRINGLVWMGTRQQMQERIRRKIDEGFRCIKLKIGGIDFDDELELLRDIRRHHPAEALELRVDANGAFTPAEAPERLKRLSDFQPHSIEQPIRAGQWEEMARICAASPVPVALDEELIGARSRAEKERLLDTIRPQYIVLKPSLCGGFSEADQWIDLAHRRGIGWWATSALESGIGLNAIAQWVSQKNPTIAQGLGTGELYVNDLPSPIRRQADSLHYLPPQF